MLSVSPASSSITSRLDQLVQFSRWSFMWLLENRSGCIAEHKCGNRGPERLLSSCAKDQLRRCPRAFQLLGKGKKRKVAALGYLKDSLTCKPRKAAFLQTSASESKESTFNARDPRLDPWVGKIPRERNVIHSSILAREIPWTEEPAGSSTVHGVTVGHD